MVVVGALVPGAVVLAVVVIVMIVVIVTLVVVVVIINSVDDWHGVGGGKGTNAIITNSNNN